MAKACIQIGYTTYVMELSDAMKIAEALVTAEMYESKWVHDPTTSGNITTYHVWEQEKSESPSLMVITDALYQNAKLAGKPPK